MANFQPSGKILIGRVPFDNSYRHTLTFSSVSEQTSFMMGRMDSSLEKDTYTYVRMNNSIRVMFNAERLYTYDYVMYQNSNYGSKWFYAFIVGVNYINENCTELVLELDVMQTWYFDYTLKQCFVEREHVNDDTVGAHLNPEPNMDLQYIYDSFEANTWGIEESYIVLLVNAYPHFNVSMTAVSGSDPVSGDRYQGQYNACKVLLYKGWVQESLDRFKEDIEAFNGCGAAETICDAFTVPAFAIDQQQLVLLSVKTGDIYQERTNVWTLTSASAITTVAKNYSRPNSVDGYTPRNNKILCYPYCYMEIGDFTGRTEDLRWEYFTLNQAGNARLSLKMAGVSDCQGYITPMFYNGVDIEGQTEETQLINSKYVKPFTFDFNNKISWVFSAYQNWAAQNAVTNQLAVIGSIAAMTGGAAAGLTPAGAALGAGLNTAEKASALIGSHAYEPFRNLAYKEANAALFQNANPTAIGGGAAGLASVVGNIERMKRVPNSSRGNTSGNSKLQNGYAGYYVAKIGIREEFARILDGFFDMYGYQVDTLKIPNRTGRPYWNYVKCQNSCHVGNVPSDMMSQINKIYDAGITFWHTSDVGNYSLDNTI